MLIYLFIGNMEGNSVNPVNVPSDLVTGLNGTIVNKIITHALTTVGPQFAHQQMRYTNQTVADKVPPEMLHLIDPHW